ncbi:MAG: hypothetical protein OHK0017_10290 [Patescibacteria group bacterium]
MNKRSPNLFTRQADERWPIALKVGLLGVIAYVLWLFNSFYLTPLIMGVISAVLSSPIHKFIKHRLSFKSFSMPGNIAAILTIILVSVVVFFTLNRFTAEILKEAPDFISDISEYATNLSTNQNVIESVNKLGIDKAVLEDGSTALNKELKRLLQIFGKPVGASNDRYMISKEDVQGAIRQGQQQFSRVFDYLVAIVIFILAWFYGLTEGKNWMKSIFALLPFTEKEEEAIKRDLKSGVQNVVYANLVSGVIHALLCFILMIIFGVPNAFILTVIIFLIGVLPLSPSEIAYAIPLSLMAIQGTNLFLVIVLAALAEIVILFVNYILIPKIISSGASGGNALLILTSILSGISIFGILGFIIGPIIMIFIQTLFMILVERLKQEEGLAELKD